MKKMMVGSLSAMALGAGLMAYALSNNKTKKKVAKTMNNAMDTVNHKMNEMK